MASGPNNPIAFPYNEPCEPPEVADFIGHSGMTLRDYFAAKALASAYIEHNKFGGKTHDEQCKEVAESCYAMADAMLKARMHDNSSE